MMRWNWNGIWKLGRIGNRRQILERVRFVKEILSPEDNGPSGFFCLKKIIFHLRQEQPLRWYAPAFFQNDLLVQSLANIIQGDFSQTYIQAHANYEPYHAPQKTVGADVVGHAVMVLVNEPFRAADLALHGFGIGVCFAKRKKVVVRKYQAGGLVEFFKVQFFKKRKMPGGVRLEGFFFKNSMVLITAPDGAEAGVGIWFYLKNAVDGNIGRQQFVHPFHECLREFTLKIKVHEILAGVHARVRPAAADHLDVCAQDG